jgi:hypothetical protein
MVVLGDVAQVQARFGPFGDGICVCARSVHCLCQMYNRLGNRFGCTQWNSYVTWVMSNLVSVHLEMMLLSLQDRCTNCAKRNIALKIILDTPDGSPR